MQMRQIMHGDIVAAACTVLDVPQDKRPQALARLLEEAHWADKITKRTKRTHIKWGNGSLMGACQTRLRANEPYLTDQHYLESLRDTIDQIVLWKQRC
jgi:hypothetical protein